MHIALTAVWAVLLIHQSAAHGGKPVVAPPPSEAAFEAVVLVVFGAFFLVAIYRSVIEGWLIVIDRKNNLLSVDGRKVCRLDQVHLETERGPFPSWFPALLRIQILVLRVPSGGAPLGYVANIFRVDSPVSRRIQVKVCRWTTRDAAELAMLGAALAEALPARK